MNYRARARFVTAMFQSHCADVIGRCCISKFSGALAGSRECSLVLSSNPISCSAALKSTVISGRSGSGQLSITQRRPELFEATTQFLAIFLRLCSCEISLMPALS
ncbi:hypothetical protein GN109_11595 [Collimonas pratensis]|uniref:hypothetical protein n=1 Tax=Collimonas pratensis TaxID=279113 RepID=UPI00143DBECE|nr:hypothetical protein [Collimonas pratensis]NKI70066.1 hypothetical protein [Collimonas pratensis]